MPGEACHEGRDAESGAMVIRLTSAPLTTNIIYCEHPYTSPDGRHCVLLRMGDFSFDRERMLLAVDLDTLRLEMIERRIPHCLAHGAWGEWFYYWTFEGSLRRFSLLTLEKQTVMEAGPAPGEGPTFVGTVCPHHRHLVYGRPTPNGPASARSWQIVRIDLQSLDETVLDESDDLANPHLQFDPVHGDRLLVQRLRGGVQLFTMNVDGGDVRPVPMDDAPSSSGHQCFVGGTRQIAIATDWNRDTNELDPRFPTSNLLVTDLSTGAVRAMDAPEHRFFHVSVSRCGRYFVADCFRQVSRGTPERPGPIGIVVGNLSTRRCRVLLRDCRAYGLCGAGGWTEPCPYFTADNRHVLYNSSPHGINQAFAAELPEGFLAELE